MSSISQVSDASRRVLTTRAKELERETGFVQRSTAQLDGPTFVHTTVFGWMDMPEASYPQLRHVAASLGVPVSSQAVEQRFGAASATLLREVLQEAVGEALCSEASAPELRSPLQWSVCTGWHDHQSASSVARRVARLWWQHPGSGTKQHARASTLGSSPGRDARAMEASGTSR
jgi:hypothetical protein